MSESDLRSALLHDEDPLDLTAMAERVVRRDRRRIWFLGIVCIVAWMMVVMLPWTTILPMLAKVVQFQDQIAHATSATGPTDDQRLRLARIVRVGTISTFFGSVASMFIAAVCTVCLIILSRRATLRQVNARLWEISAQLKAMRKEQK
jgi:ABC-type Fe3+ transport system permease subunit